MKTIMRGEKLKKKRKFNHTNKELNRSAWKSKCLQLMANINFVYFCNSKLFKRNVFWS